MTTLGNPIRSVALRAALVMLAALLLSGCAASTTRAEVAKSPQAQQLAQQLNATLTQQGLKAPSSQVLAVLYGTTGGVSCINAGNLEHGRGLVLFGSPAIGRRVFADPKLLAYDEAVVSTYCPDKLAEFQNYVNGLTTANTVP